MNKKNRSCW